MLSKCRKKLLLCSVSVGILFAAGQLLLLVLEISKESLEKSYYFSELHFNYGINQSMFWEGRSSPSSSKKVILNIQKQKIGTEEKEEQDFMRILADRMEKRREMLEKGCKRLNWLDLPPQKVKYALLKSYNLTYCFIPKAGCTNWKKVLMALNDDVKDINKIEHNIHAFVSSHYRFETAGIPPNTDHFLKMIVVRNPLDRLYSAYHDKLAWQNNGALPHFAKTSMHIHTVQSKNQNDRQHLATFEEFITYISSRKHSTMYGLEENHWSTYFRVCQPCHVKYDVIIHLETVEEDARYLLKLIGAPKKLKFPSGYGRNGSSTTSHEEVLQVFKNLKSETLMNLYEAYKTDFDMFGYIFLE